MKKPEPTITWDLHRVCSWIDAELKLRNGTTKTFFHSLVEEHITSNGCVVSLHEEDIDPECTDREFSDEEKLIFNTALENFNTSKYEDSREVRLHYWW